LPAARWSGLALLCFFLASCAGDGVDPIGIVSPPMPVTLTEIQNQIFTPRCTSTICHGGAFPQFGMNLEEGQTISNTVGVDSAELMGFFRVEPGNSTDSYLFMKLVGDPRIIGERMPFGGPFLSSDELLLVAQWIDDGALDN